MPYFYDSKSIYYLYYWNRRIQMSEEKKVHPIAFISYAWSSEDHKEWVRKLAEDLRQNGVDVWLDQWGAGAGKDIHAFMEKIANKDDTTHVIMICDDEYKKKIDSRNGGAGIEAQLIVPDYYNAESEERFVAVTRGENQDPKTLIPVFARSRIFIDFSEDEQYPARFEELLRWIYDKPIFSPPPLGEMPAYLKESHEEATPTASYARDAIYAIKNNNQHSEPKLREYLEKFSNEIKKIPDQSVTVEEKVINNIEKLMPMVNEFISLINVLSEYSQNMRAYRRVHHFFSDLTGYCHLKHINYDSRYPDKHFISYILFTSAIAIFIREERWEALSIFFNEEYSATEAIEYFDSNPTYNFSVFYQKEWHFWGSYWRRKGQNPYCPMAAFLQANFPEGIKQSDIAQADAIIYIAHQIRTMKKYPSKVFSEYWIPECFAAFINMQNKSSLPIFAHASSKKYFQNLLPILGIDRMGEFTYYFNRILEESNPFSSENNGQFKYRLKTKIPTNNLGINP